MTTLVTGGTGRTGVSLAKLLHNANLPVLLATRSGEAPTPFTTAKFDWFDRTTREIALNADTNIDRVYIVGAPVSTDASVITSFVDLAITKGVKQFFLMLDTQVEPDAHSLTPASVVHQQPIDRGVDYTVLRPIWFIPETLKEIWAQALGRTISFFHHSKWAHTLGLNLVSTGDIAQAAFDCLTSSRSPNKDIFVVGPELLSYEDAAKMVSSVLGQKFIFKGYTVEEQAAFYVRSNWNAEYARALADMDRKIEQGSEEAVFHDPTTSAQGCKHVGKRTLLQ